MKNPFLSMWLSQMNAWAGAMRGFWTAELHRQQTQMLQEMTKQMMQFWGGAWNMTGAAAPVARRSEHHHR